MTIFNVAPRYTPGSPALVNEATAHHVARDERRSYEHALSGLYGKKSKALAEETGLKGIVEQRVTRARYIEFYDILTGDFGRIKDGIKIIQGNRADLILS